jgi:sporulation protein YlmC with PRC-barrel domain
MRLSDGELRGRTVIGADGNAIGEVVGIVLDNETWSVTGLRLRLRGHVASQLGVDHSIFRPSIVEVPVGQVQSAGDAVVLTVPASSLGEHQASAQP